MCFKIYNVCCCLYYATLIYDIYIYMRVKHILRWIVDNISTGYGLRQYHHNNGQKKKKKKEKFYWSYRHIVTEHTANQSAVEKEKKKWRLESGRTLMHFSVWPLLGHNRRKCPQWKLIKCYVCVYELLLLLPFFFLLYSCACWLVRVWCVRGKKYVRKFRIWGCVGTAMMNNKRK